MYSDVYFPSLCDRIVLSVLLVAFIAKHFVCVAWPCSGIRCLSYSYC
jgi:hypothetical protein